MNFTIVLVAHGTVANLDDLPAFVSEIRRGRPAPPELLNELRSRYEAVGGSPLLASTQRLARAVEARTGVPTRVAMRLWHPRIEDVVADLQDDATLVLVPLAPYSVSVYEAAARRSLDRLPRPPGLVAVRAWGEEPRLVRAWADRIRAIDPEEGRSGRAVVLSAHSLPRFIIDQGDDYARTFESAARAVERELGRPCTIAYQSQGAQEGEWLGPNLVETFERLVQQGSQEVVVAPIGFLAEHIETLYDLDIEARAQASRLGLGFARVQTLDSDPALVETLADLVAEAQARARD